jgi:hypothetical protein
LLLRGLTAGLKPRPSESRIYEMACRSGFLSERYTGDL